MADVAVVGAGLVGCGIAFELAKRGLAVTVYDRSEPARASWAGAGMLAPFSEATPDPELLALCRDALAAYPAFVDDLRERTGIDGVFRRCGTLHVALDEQRLAELSAHSAIVARNGGEAVVLDRAAALEREPLLNERLAGALAVENEAQVDNRRLGRALTAACGTLGVRFEQVDDVSLEADARRVRGLRTSRGFAPASLVVNAAGAWAGTLGGVPPHARLAVRPVAGEMFALAVPRSAMRALIWNGNRYLVPREDGRLLVGATVDERGFDARITAAGQHALLEAALAVAPRLGAFSIVESWAGLRPASADGRPYLGATALEGYIAAAGHYRNGILLAPYTASLIAALVLDGDEAPLRAFSPQRTTVRDAAGRLAAPAAAKGPA